MKNTSLDTSTFAFAEAYRACASDLAAACGLGVPQPDAVDCTWYLDPRIEALGCLADGRIGAFILYTRQPFFMESADGEILDLWVGKDHRRTGVGHALTEAVMAQVPGAIGIQIHQSNLAAKRFWTTVCASAGRSMVPLAVGEDGENLYLLVPNLVEAGKKR